VVTDREGDSAEVEEELTPEDERAGMAQEDLEPVPGLFPEAK
jgi:hypothetical protein